MAEQTTHIPEKGLWVLKWADVAKSIIIAAVANALLIIYPIIQGGAWPSKDDWADIFRATIAFIISYLLKNLLTNNTGEILKKDKPVVTVSAEKLNELEQKAA